MITFFLNWKDLSPEEHHIVLELLQDELTAADRAIQAAIRAGADAEQSAKKWTTRRRALLAATAALVEAAR